MPHFGKTSTERLKTCDEKLQKILNNVIELYDFTIICGYRGEEEQNKAFSEGKSNAKFGQSKHNVYPSKAVDIAPYDKGIDWNDHEAFNFLATLVFDEAQRQGIKIRWGGHFKSISDKPHFELIED